MSNKYDAIIFLFATLLFGCINSTKTECEIALDEITDELGDNPPDSIWLPDVDTTANYFCDTALLHGLQKKWQYVDSMVIWPTKVSVIRVITPGPYRAKIQILDRSGVEVATSIQYFGLESIDSCNIARTRKLSYVYWNMKNKNNAIVPDGVYTWEIQFEGYLTSYTRSFKTGVVLSACSK